MKSNFSSAWQMPLVSRIVASAVDSSDDKTKDLVTRASALINNKLNQLNLNNC